MDINFFVVLGVVVAFSILRIAYENLFYRNAKPDEFDRVTIKPGALSWACGVFCVVLRGSFCFLAITSVFENDDAIFWALLGTPLTFLMGFGAYVVFWTRIRVSGAFVEYRGLKDWLRYDWDEVEGVLHHSIFGSRLHVKANRPKAIWTYGHGFKEVRELFDMYEKPFER